MVTEWAEGLRCPLGDRALGLLGVYLAELWEWNRRMNLTGLRSREEVVRELLLDSLMAGSILPAGGNLLDIGSGAGFPAIPIKICQPAVMVHLLEANARRVTFLRHVIRVMRLEGIEVFRGRAGEYWSKCGAGGYSCVTARAVAPPPQALRLGAPYLARDGRMLLFAGEDLAVVVKDIDPQLQIFSIRLEQVLPYRLPRKPTLRHLLVLAKRDADDLVGEGH